MFSDPQAPTLVAYSTTCLVLSANLLFLWVYSGVRRAKTGKVINEEDAERFDAEHHEHDPPEVARILRAHANAQAAIYPFLLLGLAYVLAGGAYKVAAIIFAVFTVARLVHSFVYLRGKQPWRSLAFVVAGLATLALMIALIWLLVAGASGRG